jgi:hypothetical protein
MSEIEFDCCPDGLFMIFLDPVRDRFTAVCIECETRYSWSRIALADGRSLRERLRQHREARRLLRRAWDEGWESKLTKSGGGGDGAPGEPEPA